MMETPEGRKDFNERTGRQAYWDAKGEELLRYMWNEAGIVHPKYTELRNCPLCGTEPQSTCLWVKEGLFYAKCTCGMVYITSPLKQDILEKVYENSDSMSKWLKVLQKQEDLDKEKFEYMLREIDKHMEDKIHTQVLDVGASYGLFCAIAQRFGHGDAVGLEISEEAYEIYLNRYYNDFQIYKEKLEDYIEHQEKEEFFDVVTLWEVLEHIPDPSWILEHVMAALKPGGLLGILVPNLNSKTARILHEKAKCFGANHLNYWNIDTLTVQLNQVGFEVLHWGTLIGDVNTWHNYLSFEEPYTGNLVHPDHEEATRNTLAEGQGYKLFVVARKCEGGSV